MKLSISRFVSWFVSIVYKSFFLTEDTGFRKAHLLAKIVFLWSVWLLITRYPSKTYILPWIILPLGVIYPGIEWIIAVISLTGIVGFAMGVSAYLLSLLGLYQMPLINILLITGRTIGIGVSIIFTVIIISFIEVFNTLYLLKARKYAVLPLLLARTIPLGVKNFLESLMISTLKKENIAKRIPPAVAGMIEVGWFIDEYCYWKIRTPAAQYIPMERSYYPTLVLLLASLILALIQYCII